MAFKLNVACVSEVSWLACRLYQYHVIVSYPASSVQVHGQELPGFHRRGLVSSACQIEQFSCWIPGHTTTKTRTLAVSRIYRRSKTKFPKLTMNALLCEDLLDPSMTNNFVRGYLREAANSKILRLRSPSGSGSYLLNKGMITTGTMVIMKTEKQNMKNHT